MKPKETFTFDEAMYIENIAERYFSYTTLAREIYRKRANRLNTNVRAGVCIAAAPFTGGLSILGTVLSGRNLSVESRKLKLLEVEWARRGQMALPERRWRDKIIPITITIGTAAFLIGIDIGIGNITPDVFYSSTPSFDLEGYLISDFAPTAVSQIGELVFDKWGHVVETVVGNEAVPQTLQQDFDSAQCRG